MTIFGESAGGGSVEIHTVAYGRSKPKENSLFQGALAQSPAPIVIDEGWQGRVGNLFLEAAGARSVDELRTLSTERLQTANQKAQDPAPYTVVFFGIFPVLVIMLMSLTWYRSYCGW